MDAAKLKGKRSFATKLKWKSHHRPLHPALRQLRVDFEEIDISEIDKDLLPSVPSKEKKVPTVFEFEEDALEDAPTEDAASAAETMLAVKNLRQARPPCPAGDTVDVDFIMPNDVTVTMHVCTSKTLAELKPEVILQAKRYPLQEQIVETTKYVYYCIDRRGVERDIYDESRTLADLNLLAPIIGLKEPEDNDIENEINAKIKDSVGISLDTIEGILDQECTEFRMHLFDSIQEAEKGRRYDGSNHYAFPEERVLKSFAPPTRSASTQDDESTGSGDGGEESMGDVTEADIDELQIGEVKVDTEERAIERLKRKIESAALAINVYFRPNDSDELTFMAPLVRDVLDLTPAGLVDVALDYLKRREGVEISEEAPDFLLQIAGKEVFLTRPIPLRSFEYIRSSFENYRDPQLILRLKKVVFANYVEPTPIFVPVFVRTSRNLIAEKAALEKERQDTTAKLTAHRSSDAAAQKEAPLIQVSAEGPTLPDDPIESSIAPPVEFINFWDMDEDLKLRIHSASHIIVTGIEKIYVKVAVTVGLNVLAQRDTPIVSPNNLRWENCVLDFGIYLKDIPKSAQLSFSLVSQRVRKNKCEATALGWFNMRLFDWEDYLLQGKKTIFFCRFPPDQTDLFNLTGVISSTSVKAENVARLEIELTDFGNKVKYPTIDQVLHFAKICQQRKIRSASDSGSGELPPIDDFSRDSVNLRKLMIVRRELEPTTMSIEDQHFLWRARHKIQSNFPSLLPIVSQLPMVWKSRENFCELYGMLANWPSMQVDAAMEMLDAQITDTILRNAAVQRIDEALDNDQLQLYLLALVQALRYEPFADSGLAKFLIKRGLLNYNVGHTLFWLLRAELNYFEVNPSASAQRVPQFYLRFAVCLEMYLRGNAYHLASIVKQVRLVDILTSLSITVKSVSAKESATRRLLQELEKQKDSLQNMVSPLNPTDYLGELIIEKCSVLGSAKQPLKLTWKNPHPMSSVASDTHQILFKNGDDLRQDMLTLQVMRIMDAKWKSYNIDYCMTIYEVLPMGQNVGMIHVVQNCSTLFQIQTTSGEIGSAFNMDNGLLNRYLYQKCVRSSKEYVECVDRFASSLAGYVIATYVLGIKDRHQDNIMLTKDGRLFHIDFGHFLGHTKRKLGINRERTEFILTEHFLYIISMGKGNFKDTYEFSSFREVCIRGFMLLRQNARFFIVLFRMMMCMGLPELSTMDDVNFIKHSFMYEIGTEEAREAFARIFDSVVKSDLATSVNWFFHSIKHV